ncbi:MAG: heat shock protein HspQ [Myxococcota bacterium]
MGRREWPRFGVGQLVHHKLFDYRGVVVDVDRAYSESEEWYEVTARTRPPKDRPWYRILVDGSSDETYVAERNLEADATGLPIEHPLIEDIFDDLLDGHYVRNRDLN